MSWPPIPPLRFSINKVFEIVDKKFESCPETGKIKGMSITIDKLKFLLKTSEWTCITVKTGITESSKTYRCKSLDISFAAKDVETRGDGQEDWDDPRFSDTERILAWRIECIRNKKK